MTAFHGPSVLIYLQSLSLEPNPDLQHHLLLFSSHVHWLVATVSVVVAVETFSALLASVHFRHSALHSIHSASQSLGHSLLCIGLGLGLGLGLGSGCEEEMWISGYVVVMRVCVVLGVSVWLLAVLGREALRWRSRGLLGLYLIVLSVVMCVEVAVLLSVVTGREVVGSSGDVVVDEEVRRGVRVVVEVVAGHVAVAVVVAFLVVFVQVSGCG